MSSWIPYSLVHQLDARVAVAEHSRRIGRRITLAEVPEEELEKWSSCHFDAVWLMGVWQTGEHSRTLALNNPRLIGEWASALPNWTPADVISSPFSISQYSVAQALGGEVALAEFRKRLAGRGIKLILDFVPNHTAPEHEWVKTNREFYIAIPKDRLQQMDKAAYFRTEDGEQLACGRDPNSPPWSDTLQLNFANADLRRTLIEVLCQIACQCDAVRCDMAMLMLKDVFNGIWAKLAGKMRAEFWDVAIAEVKAIAPDFLFLAEAYWGTEWHLQQLGFDFIYDKPLYDMILRQEIAATKRHLGANRDFARKLVRFTENHDEMRAATAFGANKKAASLLTLTLTGLRLIHEGQLEGLRLKQPLYLARRLEEEPDCDVRAFYERLLRVINDPAITRGDLHEIELKGEGASAVIAFERRCGDEGRIITAVNLSERGEEIIFSTDAFEQLRSYQGMEIISTELTPSPQFDLWPRGITLRLRPHEGLVLVARWTPEIPDR